MSVRILSKLTVPATEEQIDNIIIGMTEGLHKLNVFFEGFTYEPGIGIWLFGPREEIESVAGEGRYIEEFDVENYIKTTKDKTFWIMDYSNINDPKLLKMTK